ncbi:carbohydrate-binding protein, partial [Rhodococcus sp. CX]|nr:carbohydrate-binding protein [Rhodococcus sp. CX]
MSRRAVLTSLALVSLTLPLLAVPASAEGAAPVNSCGETGFDPAAEKPGSGAPPIEIPRVLELPVPYPEFVQVEVPGAAPDTTRVPQAPLPADPCADPCPETLPKPDSPIGGSSGSSGS